MMMVGAEGLVSYVRSFVPASLALGERAGDPWTQSWTVFNFANWMAWAPITALFLGRIAVGYTVREFILMNFLAPAGFGMVWMTIFGGAAVVVNASTGGALVSALQEFGPEAVIYTLFSNLPLAGVVGVVFVLATFISFVTAMDSNTHSIAAVTMKGDADAPISRPTVMGVKVFWGVLVGAVAFIMTATTGIAGVKMLSNLGGLPGLFILLLMGGALIMMRVRYMAALSGKGQRLSGLQETEAGQK